MVTQRKPKASKYLTTPTRPVQVDRDRSVAGLLEKMEGTGFGGRQLAEAHRIWLDMLGDNTTIIVAAFAWFFLLFLGFIRLMPSMSIVEVKETLDSAPR